MERRDSTRDYPNLVVDVAYVGNRGAWWLSSTLDNYNALTPQLLAANGLDINNSADRAILRATIGSTAAGRFRISSLRRIPVTATVAQALRPYPQFERPGRLLWAPEGRTWYDSLQMKVTKRFSHGLDVIYAFTWSKQLQIGDQGGVINGIQNRDNNKTISGFSQPLVSVVSVDYRLPAWGSNRFQVCCARLGDWGHTELRQRPADSFPGFDQRPQHAALSVDFDIRLPGRPLFLKSLNGRCVDPSKDLVLNPAAWVNPADGQFGGQPYYNDYRYQRRPSESMSLGRVFAIREKIGPDSEDELPEHFQPDGNVQIRPAPIS